MAKKGYSLEIDEDGDDSIDLLEKIIFINSKRSVEQKFFTLMHECGHILVMENDYFEIRKLSSNSGAKTKKKAVFTVIEETEAWKRGYLLCKRLGVEINKEKWDRAVSAAIMNYMRWATD